MLLIIGKIVFLLPVSCLSDAMNTFHSKDEKTTSCFLVTSSVKKKKLCVCTKVRQVGKAEALRMCHFILVRIK